MIRKAFIAASALVIAASTAEAAKKNPALDAYTDCIFDAVIKLDDGRSDARTIALGVASDCSWKRELAIVEMQSAMRPDDPGALQGLADGVRNSEEGIIISAVLEIRKKSRKRK
jgi:hypothetical protein